MTIKNLTAAALEKQAQKMVQNSNTRHGAAKVGDTVLVPIPQVDRGKTNPRNLVGIIMQIKDEYYKIGFRGGIIYEPTLCEVSV